MTNEEALKILKYRSGWNLSIRDVNALDMAIKALEQESQTFEWCTDCREYDQEKHCCHRWSKVIRNAVEEMKQPKIGYWIHTSGYNWHCSECDFIQHESKTEYKYCPNCGCRMVKPQESEDEE